MRRGTEGDFPDADRTLGEQRLGGAASRTFPATVAAAALPRTVAAPQRQQLQETSLMPHHPVVAHPACGPHPENRLQFLGAWRRTLIAFRTPRVAREASIQIGKISGLHIDVGGVVTGDPWRRSFFTKRS